MGDIFWVAEISIILGVLKISDIFGGWMVDAGPEPTYEEKKRVPPPPPPPPGLWHARLNRSHGGFLLRIDEWFDFKQYKEHKSTRNIFLIILDQWIRCCVKRSIFSSGDYLVQQSRTG